MRGNLLVRLSDCNRSAGGTEKLLMCITVAVGAEEPLAEHMMVADFFRKTTRFFSRLVRDTKTNIPS